MNIAPTAFIFRKRHPLKTKWTEWDYLLIEAVDRLELERCHCGLPVYICHSDDPRIRMRVEEEVCEATKAVEDFEEMNKGKDGYKKPAGSTLRPVPYTIDGSDFTSYRDAYYHDDNARREEVLSSLRVS